MGCCYSCNKDDSAQVVTTTRMPLELSILNVYSSLHLKQYSDLSTIGTRLPISVKKLVIWYMKCCQRIVQ